MMKSEYLTSILKVVDFHLSYLHINYRYNHLSRVDRISLCSVKATYFYASMNIKENIPSFLSLCSFSLGVHIFSWA